MNIWHEDDEFWETMAPTMFGAERWEIAPAEIDQILKLLHVNPDAHILDLCCGTSRHSFGYFQKPQENQRVLNNAAQTPMSASGHEMTITISLGVACWDSSQDTGFDAPLARAEQTLYKAKEAGRNQLAV